MRTQEKLDTVINYFMNKNDKNPIWTINLTAKSCTRTQGYMLLAYIKNT